MANFPARKLRQLEANLEANTGGVEYITDLKSHLAVLLGDRIKGVKYSYTYYLHTSLFN